MSILQELNHHGLAQAKALFQVEASWAPLGSRALVEHTFLLEILKGFKKGIGSVEALLPQVVRLRDQV